MRIPCPHCGPRAHEEFTYRGDATVRRPRLHMQISMPSTTTCTLRGNPRGWQVEMVGTAQQRLPRLLSRCCATPRRMRSRVPSLPRDASAARCRSMSAPHRPGRFVDRRTPARLPLRRPRVKRSPRRYARLRPAGQRCAAGRAVVQVPPAARHPSRRARGAERAGRVAQRRTARTEHARDGRRSCSTGWKRTARTAGPRCASTSMAVNGLLSPCSPPGSTTRPSCGLPPSGRRSTSRSSAGPPASAAPPAKPIPIL